MSTVELYWRARRGAALGLQGVENIGFDWRAVIERKDQIVARWSKGKEEGLVKLGIEVFRGRARFVGPREIQVGGGDKITGQKIIVATGSRPARPAFPGAERGIVSDELIHLKTQPARLVVIGGGFIGLEFGFALARAGSKVTILQAGPEIAPALDDDIRAALLKIAADAGIAVVTNAKVTKIAEDKTVEAEIESKTERFAADQVLLATGRPADLEELNPKNAGIDLDHGFIKVNEFLQSVTNPRVYAAGDAAGKHQHTPVAWYEGKVAAHNAVMGNQKKIDFSVFPNAVFTIPAIGQVGLTEKEARARGQRVKTSRTPFTSNPAAGVRGETDGLVKVVYDSESEKILGAHAIGAHAEDIIQIAAAGMLGGLKKSEMGAAHYIFPTLGGAIFDAMAAE